MSFTGTSQPWASPVFPGTTSSVSAPDTSTALPFPIQDYPPDSFQSAQGKEKSSSQQSPTWLSNITGFAEGMVSPITEWFKSPTSFLFQVGTFVIHAVLIGATRGAIAPAFVAIGTGLGLYGLGKGAYTMSTAKTSEDKKSGWSYLGKGLAVLGLLFLGARTALKEGVEGGLKLSGGKSANEFSLAGAMLEHFRRLPDSLKLSMQELRSGKVIKNTGDSLKRQSKELSTEIKRITSKGKVVSFSGITKLLRSLSVSTWFIR